MLNIGLDPSPRLAIALLLTHATALGCWLLLPLPTWVTLAGSALLLAHAAWTIQRHAMRPRIVGLHCDAEGGVELELRDRTVVAAQVLAESFVTPLLTIVHFRTAERRRLHAVILPDAVLPEPYRQLRVWLKWRAGKGSRDDASGGWATRV